MQLKDYARILWKRGWIIIVLAILAAGSAYVFSKLQTPIFKSTVTLSTVPSRPSDYGQTLAIKNLLRLYVQQMQSPMLTQQVIDKLQLDVTPQKFVSQIYFNADESTLTITLEARHPLPDVAAKMARTLAEVFVSYHNQENLQIDQRDRVLVNIINATSPEIFSPKTSVNTLAGAVLGALLGLVIIFVLEWLESDIIRAADDLERVIGVTVLGAIPTMTERASAPARAPMHPRKVCPHCGNPI
ncbi:MAG: Wzz/FepE/Etk N-terminal domain-containing protein [Anaerolineae bacterium]|nr:Wzz/FepE/Etk N-terminal domain-containing protein [Anaerolineae bacterium]